MSVVHMRRQHNVPDMTGTKVGRLEVVGRAPGISNARWRCLCACGGTIVVDGSYLRQALKDGRDSACRDCRPRREWK